MKQTWFIWPPDLKVAVGLDKMMVHPCFDNSGIFKGKEDLARGVTVVGQAGVAMSTIAWGCCTIAGCRQLLPDGLADRGSTRSPNFTRPFSKYSLPFPPGWFAPASERGLPNWPEKMSVSPQYIQYRPLIILATACPCS